MKIHAGCDVLEQTVFSRIVEDTFIALKGCCYVKKHTISQHLGPFYDCISVQEVRQARADDLKTTMTLHDNAC